MRLEGEGEPRKEALGHGWLPGRTAAKGKPRMPGDGEKPQVARKGWGQDGAWVELFRKLQNKSKVTHAHCSKIRKYTRTRRKVTHGAVTHVVTHVFSDSCSGSLCVEPSSNLPTPLPERSPLLPSLSPWSSLEHLCHLVGLTYLGFHNRRNLDSWLHLIS